MNPLRLACGAVLALALLSSCSSNRHSAETVTGDLLGRDFAPGVKFVYAANVSGEIEPCGCRSNPSGGIAREWNLLSGTDKTKTVIVDSGDLFYPSAPTPPFLERQWNLQAQTLVEAYNRMGFDAYSPGDLDFASGLEQFDKLRDKATFKVVSSNIFAGTEHYFKEYIVIERGGLKIAIFGLYDENLAIPHPLSVRNHLEVAKVLVPKLRKEASVVVALTHLGLEKDIELAKAVSGIDAIFGAHTQSFLQDPVRVGDTMIFQPSFRNQHVGIYENAKNTLVALDASFDRSNDGQSNPMRILADRTKKRIAELNRENEAELEMTEGLVVRTESTTMNRRLQTFPRCVECHQPQYDFYKTTRHAHAYSTLVAKQQNFNKDCLSCHTLGMNEKDGWKNVDHLVFSSTGKPVNPESFAKSLPKMSGRDLITYRQAFINVQCEHCHGPAQNHPFEGSYKKTVSTATCLKCHTETQAPGWYKDGKPDFKLIELKKKSIACPAST